MSTKLFTKVNKKGLVKEDSLLNKLWNRIIAIDNEIERQTIFENIYSYYKEYNNDTTGYNTVAEAEYTREFELLLSYSDVTRHFIRLIENDYKI